MSELGAYFIERVAGILSNLGIETAGWSDGMEHTRKENMPAIVQANAWDVLFWGVVIIKYTHWQIETGKWLFHRQMCCILIFLTKPTLKNMAITGISSY